MKPDSVYTAGQPRITDKWLFNACKQGRHEECCGGDIPTSSMACSCICHEEDKTQPKPFTTLLCKAGQHALCMAPGTAGIPIPCNCRCHLGEGLLDVIAEQVLEWDGYEDQDRPNKEGEEMRLDNKKEIEIEKSRCVGAIPQYIALGQRHLEKERSASIINGNEERFILPVDLLGLYLGDDLVKEIEEVTIAYQRK